MKDALGQVQTVLVLGGGSEIAQAIVERLAARARHVVLAARDPGALADSCAHLEAAGIETVEAVRFDATDVERHDAVVADAWSRCGDIDLVVVAFGVLPDAELAATDASVARLVVETNFTGAVSVTIPAVERLRAQGHGTIVVLSSVAGERVRRSNFVYGSTKAGLDGFFQGLADRLEGSGVSVMIVRPGFVRTRMTRGLPAAPLSTTPDAVADAVAVALQRGRTVVWVPGVLRWVMVVLRHLPRAVFRRLPL